MSDPIETLCTVLLDIAKTSPGANINDVMAQVKSALDRNTKLTNALQTDTRMLQINLGQSKGYQVLVEGNATAYIGDRYELDTDAVIKALGKLLDEIALNQNPVGTPQNLPRSGVVEFVGRDVKLIELHEQLQNNKRIAITAIAGMGGIGKTELALQYAIEQLQQGQYLAGICWLRARDREIATDIVTFAQVHLGLSLPDQLEIEDQVRFCWQRWPEGEALVVLDDVTDYQAIEPYLPPADPRFKLLITTRLDLGRSVQKIAIEELDKDSAIALLESLVGGERVRSQLADAQALCKWVGYLPLALELLGRFLARKLDWSIGILLQALDEKRLAAKALVETENGMTGQLGVAAALELSWQELNDAEQELACVLGMFAIAPIPWSLVEGCQPEVEPDDLEDIRDNGLMARSLLKRVGEGSYQLHQIVQEYFRIKLGERSDQCQSIKVNFCQLMVEIVKTIDDIPTIKQVELVRGSIPHIEEGIKSWSDSIIDEDLVQHFSGIAYFYQGQGNYLLAEPWLKNCLNVSQKRLGKKHSDVAMSMNNLARLYYSRGEYNKAKPLFLSALEMYQSIQGEDHLSVAMSMNNLALIYRAQGKYEKAEPFYLSSLKISKSLLGENNLSVAASENNLAELYCLQGEYEKAEPLYLSALTICRLRREKHQFEASILSNLGELYRCQCKYNQAEVFYLSALELNELFFGNNHSSIAVCLNNLALIREAQGRYQEAESFYLSSLEMYECLLGKEHPFIATSLNNLAILYRSQRNYEKAEKLYLSALEMNRRLLGADHPDVATGMNNLATLYESQERNEEAERLYLSALEMNKRLLGADHPDVAMNLNNLGSLYQRQGKYSKAETFHKKSLEIAEAKLGSNHPHTQHIMNCLNALFF
jgi:tetratricopeptide (TPR) repeat protein